jgi:tetrapyrrole methylase family protein/MazG family protein
MYPHWDKQPETEPDWFHAVAELARYLRSPEGCPWDRKQTSASFAHYAVEEAGELTEALAGGDDAHACEELGDALFTLLAAAAAAEAEGRFTLREALMAIHEKMIRRHAHVFGDQAAASPEDAVEVWNRIKAEEKAEKERRKAGG